MLWNKNKMVKAPVYPVLASGKFSIPAFGEGRLIPGVVIDASDNKSIIEIIELHTNGQGGDAEFIWAFPDTLFSKKDIILHVHFTKPMEVTFGIIFNIAKNFEVIDGVIHARGLCLAYGKYGDSFSGRIRHSVLMEVPDLKFDEQWNKILIGVLNKKYKNLGNKTKKLTVNEHLKSMREIWKIRRQDW